MKSDATDAQYKYLITDLDLDRIQTLLSLVSGVIVDLIEKRAIVPAEALDNDPDWPEMDLHQFIARIEQPSPLDPDREHGF